MTALLETFTNTSTPVSCMLSEWVWCLVQVDRSLFGVLYFIIIDSTLKGQKKDNLSLSILCMRCIAPPPFDWWQW